MACCSYSPCDWLNPAPEVPPKEFVGTWQNEYIYDTSIMTLKVNPDGFVDFEHLDESAHRIPMRGWQCSAITGGTYFGKEYKFEIELIDEATCKLNGTILHKMDDQLIDQDVMELTKLLTYYMKVLLADAFIDRYRAYTKTRADVSPCCGGVNKAAQYSEVMITKNAFGQMLADADLMVDGHRSSANEFGIVKSTEISLLVKAGKQLRFMKGELMKAFAEQAGMALIDGMMPKSVFLKALILAKLPTEHDARAVSKLLNFYMKSILVETFVAKYADVANAGEMFITQKAFGQMLQDADNFVDQHRAKCTEWGIKKTTEISWKIWFGRNFGMVRREIFKQFAAKGGGELQDGHLTKDLMFVALMRSP